MSCTTSVCTARIALLRGDCYGSTASDLNTTIFSWVISSMVGPMPPTPRPDCRRPANGILEWHRGHVASDCVVSRHVIQTALALGHRSYQSTRKAVWSLIMTADASSCWATSSADSAHAFTRQALDVAAS